MRQQLPPQNLFRRALAITPKISSLGRVGLMYRVLDCGMLPCLKQLGGLRRPQRDCCVLLRNEGWRMRSVNVSDWITSPFAFSLALATGTPVQDLALPQDSTVVSYAIGSASAPALEIMHGPQKSAAQPHLDGNHLHVSSPFCGQTAASSSSLTNESPSL